MLTFFARRAGLSLVTLWGVLTLTSALTWLAPGDFTEALMGQHSDARTQARMRQASGHDQGLLDSYLDYLSGIPHGEWGYSSRYNEPVWSLIRERYPRTVILAVAALSLAILLGVTAGLLAAMAPNTLFDRTVMALSLGGISAPVFWLGLIVIWLFSLKLSLLPPAGYEAGNWKYLLLPALTLAIRSQALLARMTRSLLSDLRSSHFMRTAKAKGLSEARVVLTHGLPNVSLPLLTLIGLDLGSYLSGTVLTEKVFGWPGLGRLLVDAIQARDLALVNACVTFIAAIFILVNLLVDTSYALLDPRVRKQ